MKYFYLLLPFLLLNSFLCHPLHAQEEPTYKTNRQIKNMLSDDSTASNLYVASWNYSFIGEYNKALISFDRAEERENEADVRSNTVKPEYSTQPAVEYIVNRSKKEQIIIINEAHHQPLHRVFTESLLEGLYKNGYRYFGMEALAEDSLINIRKWPLQDDGYYVAEPQFGNMIRKALKIGFVVFGYESSGNGKIREIGQAKNIQKILAKNPDAKMLLHCGFSHVVEGKVPVWGKAMAGELKSRSGINPLTIDQVELSERSLSKYESSFYKPDSINSSTILIDKKGNPIHFRTESYLTDLKVMHPRSKFISGRPDWLLRNNSWRVYDLKTLKFDVEFPCLVAAYHSVEGETSVPVDQIEISNATEKSIVLPVGAFELQITDQKGRIQKVNIVVE